MKNGTSERVKFGCKLQTLGFQLQTINSYPKSELSRNGHYNALTAPLVNVSNINSKTNWTVRQSLTDVRRKLIVTNNKPQKNKDAYQKVLESLKACCEQRGKKLSFSLNRTHIKFKGCIGKCNRIAMLHKTAQE